MKSVVFICLLSLSLSLSQPTTSAAPKDAHPEGAVAPKENAAKDVKPPAEQAKTPTHFTNTTDTTQKAPTETQTVNETTVNNQMKTGTNETVTNETSAKTAMKPDESKVENKTETDKKNETSPAIKPEEATKDYKNFTKKEDAESKPAEGTQGVAKKNETITTEKTTAATTEKPKDVQPVQARKFDGPSFFGGIVLTLGLLAIGFMGYKYYKNQTDGNYHTL